MAEWELILTGTGTSHGNPPWGNPNIWSNDPRDHRRRSGAILKGPGGEVILIDAGPDLMHQLRDPYKRTSMYDYPTDCICRCDGVLITHDHADHCHDVDRAARQQKREHHKNLFQHLSSILLPPLRSNQHAAHRFDRQTAQSIPFAVVVALV